MTFLKAIQTQEDKFEESFPEEEEKSNKKSKKDKKSKDSKKEDLELEKSDIDSQLNNIIYRDSEEGETIRLDVLDTQLSKEKKQKKKEKQTEEDELLEKFFNNDDELDAKEKKKSRFGKQSNVLNNEAYDMLFNTQLGEIFDLDNLKLSDNDYNFTSSENNNKNLANPEENKFFKSLFEKFDDMYGKPDYPVIDVRILYKLLLFIITINNNIVSM